MRFALTRLILAGWLAPLIAVCAPQEASHGVDTRVESLPLQRGSFEVAWYMPGNRPVGGLCVLGSGDGGWSYWETRVASHLAKTGWAVAGIDFAKYAATDYDQKTLVTDYARLVGELVRRAGSPAGGAVRPVIYAGWSMGAEQALPAAAALAERPPGLRGLLLVAPGARGRYGLHTADKLGISPAGEGSFALADFAARVRDVRIAQLHAGLDPLDSIKWYHGTRLDLRLWKYPRAFHDFDNASDEFLALMDQAIAWLLLPGSAEEKSNE